MNSLVSTFACFLILVCASMGQVPAPRIVHRTVDLRVGEAALRQVRSQYVAYCHVERNHQGKGNVILFPDPANRFDQSSGTIATRQRLGWLLNFYYREAA